MEIVVPLAALSGFYLINKQSRQKNEKESFNNQNYLPNTNTPDVNYPAEKRVNFPESEVTAELST